MPLHDINRIFFSPSSPLALWLQICNICNTHTHTSEYCFAMKKEEENPKTETYTLELVSKFVERICNGASAYHIRLRRVRK